MQTNVKTQKGLFNSNDIVIRPGNEHTQTPVDTDALMVILLGNGYLPERAAFIVRAVNSFEHMREETKSLRHSHEELLRIAKRYKLSLGFGNVDERAEIEKAISKAEGK